MGVICKYKFDSSVYPDLIPEFNSGYSGYTITDEVEGNIIIRTIESDELPILMRFGRTWVEGEAVTDNRTDSLLEVLDMNTSGLTNCRNMFRYNKNLTSITCEWDTSNVTNMNSMFSECYNLTSLDVGNFHTSKVTNMNYMFYNCKSLTSLDLSNFDTSNVTNMSSMFSICKSLTTLDVNNWNTSKVTNMSYMFNNCQSLTSLDVSNFDTINVTSMEAMFHFCYNLTSLDISNFDTSKVTDMRYMFYNCYNLTSLNVSNFDTSKVTDMNNMFAYCNKLTTLDLSNFDTSKVTNTTNMFTNTNSLEVIAMFDNDIDTINVVGNLTSATIYVDKSLDQSQYIGTAPLKVYKEEKLKIKLNSPLLEGDTIEVVGGKLCHVHRWEKVVLDGSEDEEWQWKNNDNRVNTYNFHCKLKKLGAMQYGTKGFSDNFKWGGAWNDYEHIWLNEAKYLTAHISIEKITSHNADLFKQWLSENPITVVYELAEPYYEDITPLQSSIILKTFLESSMTIDTNLPIETKLSYRTNVPSISALSTRATELAESDNVIHNLMNIIDDEVDE